MQFVLALLVSNFRPLGGRLLRLLDHGAVVRVGFGDCRAPFSSGEEQGVSSRRLSRPVVLAIVPAMTRRLLPALLLALLCATMAVTGHSQSLPEWLAGSSIASPPDFGVRDENSFFGSHSGSLTRIAGQIHGLKEKHGFRLYVIVEPVLIASTAPELAALLQEAWLPDANGMVVVYESDNRSLGFGSNVTAQAPTQALAPGVIPTHEQSAIIRRAMAAADPQLAPEAYLESLVAQLSREIDGYFTRRSQPPPPARSLRLALLAAGGLAAVGLAAITAGAVLRMPSFAAYRRLRFPQVDVPERLSAPRGGGHIAARRFLQPTTTTQQSKTPSPP